MCFIGHVYCVCLDISTYIFGFTCCVDITWQLVLIHALVVQKKHTMEVEGVQNKGGDTLRNFDIERAQSQMSRVKGTVEEQERISQHWLKTCRKNERLVERYGAEAFELRVANQRLLDVVAGKRDNGCSSPLEC